MENIVTKQQERAQFALKVLSDKISKNEIDDKLANFIVGMPNMILSNGLGQTMAFLMAKMGKKSERKFVFYAMKEYLCTNYEAKFGKFERKSNENDELCNNFEFLSNFNKLSQGEYVKIQEEALRMFEWLKRYARAFEK